MKSHYHFWSEPGDTWVVLVQRVRDVKETCRLLKWKDPTAPGTNDSDLMPRVISEHPHAAT